MKKQKIRIGWNEIERLVNQICFEIKDRKFKCVYGIARGGMIPAIMISHKTNVKFVRNPMNLLNENKADILVVDDICDSGRTLSGWRTPTATLHYKINDLHQPTFYGEKVASNHWIEYPWERKDSKTIRDYKSEGNEKANYSIH